MLSVPKAPSLIFNTAKIERKRGREARSKGEKEASQPAWNGQ